MKACMGFTVSTVRSEERRQRAGNPAGKKKTSAGLRSGPGTDSACARRPLHHPLPASEGGAPGRTRSPRPLRAGYPGDSGPGLWGGGCPWASGLSLRTALGGRDGRALSVSHTHTLIHTHTCSCTNTYTHTRTHSCVQTHSYTHTHTCTHVHTHILTLTHVRPCSYTHALTRTHSHTPTHTHTLKHTLFGSYTHTIKSPTPQSQTQPPTPTQPHPSLICMHASTHARRL